MFRLGSSARVGSLLLSAYGGGGISFSAGEVGAAAGSVGGVIDDDLKDLMHDFSDMEELKRMSGNQRGFCQPDFLAKSELSHMESPEVDQKQEDKITKQAADLFSRIPLPEDPMKAALRPTREEVEAQEKYEVYKEAVREKYRNRVQRSAVESARIDKAMKQVEEGTYKLKTERCDEEVGGYKPYVPAVDPALKAQQDAEKQELQDELAAARAKLAALEELLKAQQQR